MTKRELREERRAHREAREAAQAAAVTRRRRLTVLGGALAAAVAVIVVAALVSTRSSSDAAPSGASLARSTVVEGVPERDGVLGDPDAPVTVTEYVDLQCPICAEASTTTLPTLIEDYVKTGKVKLELRTMHFLGPDSVTAARVAAGAQRQDKLWSFVETFYANQGTENSGYASDAFLRDVARAAGVDADAALAFADTDASERALTRANQAAQAVGADSTPTFTVKRGDGAERIIHVGAGDISAELEKAL